MSAEPVPTPATTAPARRGAGAPGGAGPDAPGDHEVVRERHLDVAPDRVWEVIADRGTRRDFLGGDLDVELEPGSAGTFDAPDGPVPARVRRVRAGRHLQLDWGRPDDASSVDIHVDPCHDGTHVTIRERRPTSPAPRLASPAPRLASHPTATDVWALAA